MRNLRRLQKKLRQIDELKLKMGQGATFKYGLGC